MVLYEWKTDRFNKLFNFAFHVVLLLVFLVVMKILELNGYELIYGIGLVGIYGVMLIYGIHVFKEKYDFPQALSLAFNLLFFNSVYWEIPIHIYTPIRVGFIDATTPLHFIYVFPLIFIHSKLELPRPHRKYYLRFLLGILVSVVLNSWIFITGYWLWDAVHPYWVERIWDLNRFLCFLILLWIYVEAKPKEKR